MERPYLFDGLWQTCGQNQRLAGDKDSLPGCRSGGVQGVLCQFEEEGASPILSGGVYVGFAGQFYFSMSKVEGPMRKTLFKFHIRHLAVFINSIFAIKELGISGLLSQCGIRKNSRRQKDEASSEKRTVSFGIFD